MSVAYRPISLDIVLCEFWRDREVLVRCVRCVDWQVPICVARGGKQTDWNFSTVTPQLGIVQSQHTLCMSTGMCHLGSTYVVSVLLRVSLCVLCIVQLRRCKFHLHRLSSLTLFYLSQYWSAGRGVIMLYDFKCFLITCFTLVSNFSALTCMLKTSNLYCVSLLFTQHATP